MAEVQGLPIAIAVLTAAVILLVAAVIFLAATIRIVPESRRMAIFRMGRYIGDRGPGLVILLPFIDRSVLIDIGDEAAEAEALRATFGVVGMTQTQVYKDGTVEIEGKPWNAVSQHSIPSGTRVRVTKVILEVEGI